VIASDEEWAEVKRELYPHYAFLAKQQEQEEADTLLNKDGI